MAVWEFNKGEWTEAYVFLRLLGDGRIYGASAQLVKVDKTYIDIINVIRDEPNCYMKFERFMEERLSLVKATDRDDGVIKIITAPELSEKAAFLYKQIMSLRAGQKKTISVPEIQLFLEELKFKNPKANLSDSAKEQYGSKTDIIITSQNSLDNSRTTEGFSIKSHMGSNPTLFNMSQTSGFKYLIPGCKIEDMHRINALDSIKTMISAIQERFSLRYLGCRNDIFEQNIGIVDSRMDEILNEALLLFYGYRGDEVASNMESICVHLAQRNPLNVKNPNVFYIAKIKDLLFASFAGLTASSPWNGRKKLTGGYIDVSTDGDLLYYRAISDDIFSSYLFQNTKFEVPDRGVNKALALKRANVFIQERRDLTLEEENAIIYKSTGKKASKKGNFGYIYQQEEEFYIDLNFQIRFR